MIPELDEIKLRHNGLLDYNQGVSAWDSAADVPRLVAALEAVLDLHYRESMTIIHNDSLRRTYICDECSQENAVPYPCPTVTAIQQALGGGQ